MRLYLETVSLTRKWRFKWGPDQCTFIQSGGCPCWQRKGHSHTQRKEPVRIWEKAASYKQRGKASEEAKSMTPSTQIRNLQSAGKLSLLLWQSQLTNGSTGGESLCCSLKEAGGRRGSCLHSYWGSFHFFDCQTEGLLPSVIVKSVNLFCGGCGSGQDSFLCWNEIPSLPNSQLHIPLTEKELSLMPAVFIQPHIQAYTPTPKHTPPHTSIPLTTSVNHCRRKSPFRPVSGLQSVEKCTEITHASLTRPCTASPARRQLMSCIAPGPWFRAEFMLCTVYFMGLDKVVITRI